MPIAWHGIDGAFVLAGQVLELMHFVYGLAIEPERLSTPALFKPRTLHFSFESKHK